MFRLGEILKAYAKEVIRQQPENIFEFSARYFAQLDQHEEEFEAGTIEAIFFRFVLVIHSLLFRRRNFGVTRCFDWNSIRGI